MSLECFTFRHITSTNFSWQGNYSFCSAQNVAIFEKKPEKVLFAVFQGLYSKGERRRSGQMRGHTCTVIYSTGYYCTVIYSMWQKTHTVNYPDNIFQTVTHSGEHHAVGMLFWSMIGKISVHLAPIHNKCHLKARQSSYIYLQKYKRKSNNRFRLI